MNTDKTDLKCFGGGTQICGRTVVVIVFDFINSIPPSIILNTSETQLVVEFSTQIDSVFTNGFAKDLGKQKYIFFSKIVFSPYCFYPLSLFVFNS